jgi:hypothetical protein
VGAVKNNADKIFECVWELRHFFNDKPLFLLPEFKIWIQDGAVAQLVEQRTENPCVAGSIPAHTT